MKEQDITLTIKLDAKTYDKLKYIMKKYSLNDIDAVKESILKMYRDLSEFFRNEME